MLRIRAAPDTLLASFKARDRRPLVSALAGLCILVGAIDLVAPPPLERARNAGVMVYDREGEWLHAIAAEDQRWRFHVSLEDVDPQLVENIIRVEDKRFYGHLGVDPLAIARAVTAAVRTGRIESGASTITMQVARLLEPRPRTIWSKIIECGRAMQLERRLTKREILEVYLLLAPYGGNLEGVRAASLAYFGKEPKTLSIAEQAMLIALPQAPEARRPDLRDRNATSVQARNKILKLIADKYSLAEVQAAADQPVPVSRKAFPRFAYHASQSAIRAEVGGEVVTTLDGQLQVQAERLLSQRFASLSDPSTSAAIVANAHSGEILALVGSSARSKPGGWIDLSAARRSPGSLLKPFIYAVAFDDGVAQPNSILMDQPTNFDGYAPENFDRKFRGEVSIRDALRHSLNVPAVQTLDHVDSSRFANMLRNVGVAVRVHRKTPYDDYGLPTALGGVGMSLRDLTSLYTTLSNGGIVKPLTLVDAGSSTQGSVRLLSQAAAQDIAEILSTGPSLEGRAPSALIEGAPSISYKTGTSYGYRDAWAIGVSGEIVIGVWTGRADGAARAGMTGRRTAAPILFDLFDIVHAMDGPISLEQPTPSRIVWREERRRKEASFTAPKIKFPADKASFYIQQGASSSHGISLIAHGAEGDQTWYANGHEIAKAGKRRWRPSEAGTYELVVVDRRGLSDKVIVNIDSSSRTAFDASEYDPKAIH